MTIIDDTTIVVSNQDELRSAIQGVYTLIYFDQDIAITSGIKIPADKTELTVDGTYNNTRHKYVDTDSAFALWGIYANEALSVSSQTVTFKNMDVTGHNYFGIVCGYEISGLQNLTIVYDNINYVGPQPCYHPNGTSKIVNCTFLMNSSNGSLRGEIGEVHNVILDGDISLTNTFNDYTGFAYRGGAGGIFSVLPNSNIDITVARDFFTATNPVTFTFGENSTVNVLAPSGVSSTSSDQASSVTIAQNASVQFKRTKGGLSACFYINGSLTVNENALFYMEQNYSNSVPLLNFAATNATITLNDPKSFVLYNKSSYDFSFTGTANFSIVAEQINQWNTAADISIAGSINDLPTYSWNKDDTTLANIAGTATNATTTISSNNFSDAEIAKLPALNLLQFRTSRVLAVGKKPKLNINAIVSGSTTIDGLTKANAGVKVTIGSNSISTTADENGNFSVDEGTALAVGTVIDIISAIDFFNNKREVTVVYPGELSFDTIPETIPFNPKDIVGQTPILLARNPEDWKIIVYDSRIYSSDWKVSASINGPLKSSNGYELNNALVYINSDKNLQELSSTPIEVFRGSANQGSTLYTNVTWDKDIGILVRLTADTPLENGEVYVAVINWELEAVE